MKKNNIDKFGQYRLDLNFPVSKKEAEPISEKEKAFKEIRDLVFKAKRVLRFDLLQRANFFSLLERNMDAFVDFDKIKEISDNRSYGSLAGEMRSGMGAYKRLNSFYKHSVEKDLKALKNDLERLKSAKTQAAIYIKMLPEYPMIKKIIEELQ